MLKYINYKRLFWGQDEVCSNLLKVQLKSQIRLLKVKSPLAGSLDDFFFVVAVT